MSVEATFQPHIILLTQLDSQDLEVIRLTGEIETLRREVAGQKAVIQKQEAAMNDMAARIKRAEGIVEESEQELERLTSRITRTENYDGVKHQKDFDAAKQSLQRLKEKRNAVEESGLEAMVELDELNPALEKLRGQMKILLSGYAHFRQEKKVLYGELSQTLTETKARREGLIAELGALDPRVQERYLWLMERHGDRATTVVVDDRCTFCHLPVIIQQCLEVAAGQALHGCASCSRYLGVRKSNPPQNDDI